MNQQKTVTPIPKHFAKANIPNKGDMVRIIIVIFESVCAVLLFHFKLETKRNYITMLIQHQLCS